MSGVTLRAAVKRAAPISVLLLSFVCVTSSQSSNGGIDKAQNLRGCLDGFQTCDRSLLTSVQAKQIADIQQHRPVRFPHEPVHLLVFLGELLAVDRVFGFITGGDEFPAAAQDMDQGLLITTLGG